MDSLTSPDGALGLATTVLVIVVGYRVARPERRPDWLAVLGYAGAMAVIFLGGRGSPDRAATHLALRLVGAAALLVGLVVAGAGVRASRRGVPPRDAAASPLPRHSRPLVHAGLLLALVGQLLRAPTQIGALALGVALVPLAWASWASWRGRSPVQPGP